MGTETYGSRKEWLAARRTGLGASDIPVLFGLSPWKDPFSLWAEKVGAAEPDAAESEAQEWGIRLQPIVAEKYAEETQRPVRPVAAHTLERHPQIPFLLASLDAEIDPVNERGPGALECKTTSAFKADEWTDHPPMLYQVQLQAQLLVKGWSWGSLAVLIGGQSFRWADLDVHVEMGQLIAEKAATFWRLVEAGTPPPAGANASAKAVLEKLYPRETPGLTVELSSEALAWDLQLQEAKAQIKTWEEKQREAENWLRGAIGEAERGVLPGGVAYSLKRIERKEYVAKATVFRSLRRHVT